MNIIIFNCSQLSRLNTFMPFFFKSKYNKNYIDKIIDIY